jgi:hypothetical protein
MRLVDAEQSNTAMADFGLQELAALGKADPIGADGGQFVVRDLRATLEKAGYQIHESDLVTWRFLANRKPTAQS